VPLETESEVLSELIPASAWGLIALSSWGKVDSWNGLGWWLAVGDDIIELDGFDEAGGVFADGHGVEVGLAAFDLGALAVPMWLIQEHMTGS
jgi:hypothetical protein